jgi:hypothetical protein
MRAHDVASRSDSKALIARVLLVAGDMVASTGLDLVWGYDIHQIHEQITNYVNWLA